MEVPPQAHTLNIPGLWLEQCLRPAEQSKIEAKGRAHHLLLKIVMTLTAILLYWLVSTTVIWSTYGAGQDIFRGRSYSRAEAATACAQMALITTVLTIPIWFIRKQRRTQTSFWQQFWPVSWKTAIVLFLYALIVILRWPGLERAKVLWAV